MLYPDDLPTAAACLLFGDRLQTWIDDLDRRPLVTRRGPSASQQHRLMAWPVRKCAAVSQRSSYRATANLEGIGQFSARYRPDRLRFPFAGRDLHRPKVVKPRCVSTRIFLPDRRIGCPFRQLVEQQAVVDRERRRDIRQRPSAAVSGIGMRPVAAPDDSIRIGRDQRLRQRGVSAKSGALSEVR